MNDTQDDLMKICSVLANRYKDAQEYEDLFQEGFLAGWGALQSGETDFGVVVGKVRRAMNDYKNITLKPVSIPKSGDTYALLGAINKDQGVTPQGSTQVALYEALTGSTDLVQENTLGVTKGSEHLMVEKETYRYVINNLLVYLEPQEAVVILLVYTQGYTQGEVAQELGLSQGRVSKCLTRGLEKMKKALEQVT